MTQTSQTIFSEEKTKRDMMELWKDTFHDSSRYVDIVFGTYFNTDNICVRYEGERLVASLLGVPYDIRIDGRDIRGMYLCGLATVPDKRRQGIMGRMMQEIEERAVARGFDLCFLIPADDDLREYYRRKGYADANFLSEPYVDGITGSDCGYAESTDGLMKVQVHRLPEAIKDDWIHAVAEWCGARERECGLDKMMHSTRDYGAALRENENSFFVTKASCDLKYPILAKIVSVGFPDAKFGVPDKSSGSPYGMAKALNSDMEVSEHDLHFAMSLLLD